MTYYGKLQKFVDTTYGWTATIRRTDTGFVLRVRQDDGLQLWKETFASPEAAKAALEGLLIVTPECMNGLRGNWWTVAGYVGELNPEGYQRNADRVLPWWDR